jgi:hypothetical protein
LASRLQPFGYPDHRLHGLYVVHQFGRRLPPGSVQADLRIALERCWRRILRPDDK